MMLGKFKGKKEGGDRGWDGWMVSSMDLKLEQALGDSEGQRSLVCCSHVVAKSWTWLSDWTTIGWFTCSPRTSHLREWWDRRKLEAAASYNLILVVIHLHLCRTLLVMETDPGTVWEASSLRCAYRRQGSFGVILQDGYNGRVWGDSSG